MDLTRGKKKSNYEYTKAYLQKTPAARLYTSSFVNAKARGIEHKLTVKYIESIMVDTCPYLGVKLTNNFGQGKGSRHRYNPSIDRIDLSKGYVEGNVQIISTLANKMKQDASVEELIAFAIGILAKHGK